MNQQKFPSLVKQCPCAGNSMIKVTDGQSESRTRKVLLPADFESAASTNSAIRPVANYYATATSCVSGLGE